MKAAPSRGLGGKADGGLRPEPWGPDNLSHPHPEPQGAPVSCPRADGPCRGHRQPCRVGMWAVRKERAAPVHGDRSDAHRPAEVGWGDRGFTEQGSDPARLAGSHRRQQKVACSLYMGWQPGGRQGVGVDLGARLVDRSWGPAPATHWGRRAREERAGAGEVPISHSQTLPRLFVVRGQALAWNWPQGQRAVEVC